MNVVCKMIALSMLSLFFTSHVLAQSQCEQSLLTAEQNATESDLLIRESAKLKQDLQTIRSLSQESLLEEQGFPASYYKGVDQAREFNAVARHLRAINADPNQTHIPYFSDQIEKTISDFEGAFKKHNQDDPEFLKERLAILEEMKKEAQQRIADRNVTYDWWATFNLRLSMIADKSDIAQELNQYRIKKYRIKDKLPDEKIHNITFLNTYEGTKEFFSDIVRSTRVHTSYSREPLQLERNVLATVIDTKDNFPEDIIFFATDELGIMAFNRLEDNLQFVSASRTPNRLQELGMRLRAYLDNGSVRVSYDKPRKVSEEMLERIDNISNPSDRIKAELVLGLYLRDNNDIFYLEELIDFYQGTGAYMYRSSKKKLKKRTRRAIKDSIGIIRRFLDPNDLQGMLPDNVNKNDEKEVRKFLTKAIIVFGNIEASMDGTPLIP